MNGEGCEIVVKWLREGEELMSEGDIPCGKVGKGKDPGEKRD
jgi:hypothetical protein